MEIVMNKYTILSVLKKIGLVAFISVLPCFSLIRPSWIGSRLRPALRVLGAFQAKRSVAQLSDVLRIHQMLSAADKKWSALYGVASLWNGAVAQALMNEETKKLAALFFNKKPGEAIRFTVAPGNVAVVLTPELVADLIRMYRARTLSGEEFFETETAKKWQALYKRKNFRQQLRYLIKELEALPPDKCAALLTAVAYSLSHTREDLLLYVQKAGCSLEWEKAQESSECSTILLRVLESRWQLDRATLIPEENPLFNGRCAEKTLWAFINTILYNPRTKTFDLSLLPQAVRATCHPSLLHFIEKYSDPHIPLYYRTACKEFFALVAGLPGVTYEKLGKNAPLYPDKEESGKVLQHLFGTKADTIIGFCKEVSIPGERSIACCEKPKEQKVCFSLNAVGGNPEDTLEGFLDFSDVGSHKHAFFAFELPKSRPSRQDLLKVMELEQKEQYAPGTLLKAADGYLHTLIDWKNASKETMQQVERDFSLTMEDLSELSQGLGIDRETLLHTAALQGNRSIVRYLLSRGLKSSVCNSQGHTPIKSCVLAFDRIQDEAQKNAVVDCLVLLCLYRAKEKLMDFWNVVIGKKV